MSRRLFPGRLADEMAGDDHPRAERLKRLARELVGVVREGLIRDGQVRIHGFGTFRLRPARARKGINPRTGESIDIPARYRVLFRPAKALRERIEPGAAPAVPLAEPHASREAVLGGVMSEAPAAGAVPASDEAGQRRGYFPDRIAAAAISDTVVRTTGEPPAAASGSREANLGGTMGDSPSAGRIPPVSPVTADESRPAIDADAGATAANEEHGRGSREATLGGPGAASTSGAGTLPAEDLPPEAQEPDRPATVPATRHGPGPLESAPGEAGLALPGSASREAGLSGEATAPPAGGLPDEEEDAGDAATGFEAGTPVHEGTGVAAREEVESGDGGEFRESGPADEGAATVTSRPFRQRIAIEDGPGPDVPSEPGRDEARTDRSRRSLLLLLLLLVLLIAALAWWFWPRAETPPVTQTSDTGAVEETEPAAASTAPEAGDDSASGTAASGETMSTSPAAEDTATAADDTQTATVDEPAGDGTERTDTSTRDSAEPAGQEEAMTTAAGEAAAPVPEEPASRSGPETEATAAEAPAAAGAGSAEAAGTDKPWFSGHGYSVQRGDTLWGLSDDHYVNPYYWPHIWNHNQALTDPDRIEIDQQLWLPTLQGEPRSLTATDRRSIAEGYLRLYRLWTETGAANPQYALIGVRYFDPEVMPPELRNDPSAGRPDDTLAAAFEAHLQAAFPRR